MPPKPDQGKKKVQIVIDGKEITEMDFPQLQLYTVELYEKLLKEREERTFFQMERDKLRTYGVLACNQLGEVRAQIKNKEYALELAEERRLKELNEVNQRFKFLIYDQKLEFKNAKVREREKILLDEKKYGKHELELLKDKTQLKMLMKVLEEKHHKKIEEIRCQHFDDTNKTRETTTKAFRELMVELNHRYAGFHAYQAQAFRLDYVNLLEKKNTQINSIAANHNHHFNNLRNFLNNITFDHFSLITNLMEYVDTMNTNDVLTEKKLKDTSKENKSITENLKKETSELHTLQHELEEYTLKRLKLESMNREVSKTSKEIDNLKANHGLLSSNYQNNKMEKLTIASENANQVAELSKIVDGRIIYLQELARAVNGQVERRKNLINNFRTIIYHAKDNGIMNKPLVTILDVIENYIRSIRSNEKVK